MSFVTRVVAAGRVVAAAALLLQFGTAGLADDVEPLSISEASARFDSHPRTGERRDTLDLRGTFPSLDGLRGFDAASETLRVTVSGITVFDAGPPPDPGAFRSRSRRAVPRRWSYRLRGAAGSEDSRVFQADLRTGEFRLVVRRADLRAVRDLGASDVTIAVAVGGSAAETTFSFFVVRALPPVVWRWRDVPGTPPPDGQGYQPPPLGPLAWTVLDSGNVSGVRTKLETLVRDDAAWQALWSQHKGGTPPAVDFTREMVVAIFLGDRPWLGTGAQLVWVSHAAANVEAAYMDYVTSVAPGTTQPYVLARVPRVDKPGAFVVAGAN